jgi:hypothetical protein
VRIGDSSTIKWRGTGVAGATGAKKTGPAGTIPEDPNLKWLNDYESYQRQAFEAQWWDEPIPWLHDQLAVVRSEMFQPGTTKERRIRAEIWAIERILKRREESS